MQLYVPYGDRSTWSDVEPVLQDDGDDPPVSIRKRAEAARVVHAFVTLLIQPV